MQVKSLRFILVNPDYAKADIRFLKTYKEIPEYGWTIELDTIYFNPLIISDRSAAIKLKAFHMSSLNDQVKYLKRISEAYKRVTMPEEVYDDTKLHTKKST
jgi:hypothetical protein